MKRSYIQSDLKASNRKLTYDYLTKVQVISRAELSRVLGISGATILKIIDYFVENNVCYYEEPGDEYISVGRKPMMIRFNPDFAHTISIFVEGNYISVAIVNMAGEIRAIKEFRVLDVWNFLFHGLDPIFESLIAEVENCNPVGIGIALPAVISIDSNEIIEAPLLGIVEPSSLPSFIAKLEETFKLPVCVQNDVNASAYGEYMNNYFDKTENMLYISVGTGVGCGIVMNSQIVMGESNSAGEIGYMILDEDSDMDRTKGGWLENRINLSAITKELEESTGRSGRDQVVEYIAQKLSISITNITTVLDINTIVLGGIIVEDFGQQLIDAVQKKCDALHYQRRKIVLCKTYKAGVIGLSHIASEPTLESLMAE